MPSIQKMRLIALALAVFWMTPLDGLFGREKSLIPGDQVALSISDTWDSMTGRLWLLDKKEHQWKTTDGPWRVIYGRSGLAWGIGLHPAQKGQQKVERDGRAPAGIFKIGKVYSNQPKPLEGAEQWPFYHVTKADAWIDDPEMPEYNHIVRVDLKNPPAWFEKQRMKIEDRTYTWRLLIEHNYPRAKPGMGSAIFFHFQRGHDIPSAGCTVMPPDQMEALLRWLRPEGKPVLVQLTKSEYLRLWKIWGLPEPRSFGL